MAVLPKVKVLDSTFFDRLAEQDANDRYRIEDR
jgi:hypothetical protein